MSLRSPRLRILGLCATIAAVTATGALAGSTLGTAPALAAGPTLLAAGPATEAAHNDYKGRVIAKSGLLLRDKPTRSSRIIRKEPYGAIVHIFCKTPGDSVNGNNRWYLLTDGTWAWGAAEYIANIGPAPRWC